MPEVTQQVSDKPVNPNTLPHSINGLYPKGMAVIGAGIHTKPPRGHHLFKLLHLFTMTSFLSPSAKILLIWSFLFACVLQGEFIVSL